MGLTFVMVDTQLPSSGGTLFNKSRPRRTIFPLECSLTKYDN